MTSKLISAALKALRAKRDKQENKRWNNNQDMGRYSNSMIMVCEAQVEIAKLDKRIAKLQRAFCEAKS